MQDKRSSLFSLIAFILTVAFMATFFISIVYHFFYFPLPSQNSPVILYSNHLNHSLKRVFTKALISAKKEIIAHSYALSDSQLIGILLNKTNELNHVEIITDSKTFVSSFEPQKKALNWKEIKSSGLMHEKILLIDDYSCFLGTANMTAESLMMHDNLVLGFYSKELYLFLKKYTENMHLIKKIKNRDKAQFFINNQLLDLWMLPFKGIEPTQNLLNEIDQAKRSIYVSMFTLTHPQIISSLIKAHQKGVKVKIFLDKTASKGASMKARSELLGSSVPLYISQGVQLLHHKMVLIDESKFILGSANWTSAAFKKNHDFYLSLSPLSKKQSFVLLKIFKQIERECRSDSFD